MPVEVRRGKTWRSLVTEDVSFGGLFVRDGAPEPLRQLVRLRARLPYSDAAFETNVVVTRSLAPSAAGDAVPGMGLAFYGLAGPEREKWDHFVLRAAADSPELAEIPFRARRMADDEIPQSFPHAAVVLEIRLARLEDLFVLHSRDGSRAGIFLEIPPEFTQDEPLVLRVVHQPSDAELWVPCVVRRVVRTRLKGIAVEIAKDVPGLSREFHDFLSRLIEVTEH
jgi:hypothetical protein